MIILRYGFWFILIIALLMLFPWITRIGGYSLYFRMLLISLRLVVVSCRHNAATEFHLSSASLVCSTAVLQNLSQHRLLLIKPHINFSMYVSPKYGQICCVYNLSLLHVFPFSINGSTNRTEICSCYIKRSVRFIFCFLFNAHSRLKKVFFVYFIYHLNEEQGESHKCNFVYSVTNSFSKKKQIFPGEPDSFMIGMLVIIMVVIRWRESHYLYSHQTFRKQTVVKPWST